MSGFRRIVTGHDQNGRSIVISDTPTTNVIGSLNNFWKIEAVPADIDAPDPCAGEPLGLHPPHGGVTFRFFQIQPEASFADISREDLYEFARQRFIDMGAEDALVDRTRHPGMHKTRSVDFIVLLSGQVTLLLDEADVPMQPFDVVVQRGTNHAWANTGDEVATLMAVLVDAKA
jgi:hypothetical protein